MADHRLSEVCASVRDVFDARCCTIAAPSRAGDLEFVAADGLGAEQIVGSRLGLGEGVAGHVAQTGAPVELFEVGERWGSTLPVRRSYVPDAYLSAPLVGAGGELVGVLTVLDPSPEVAEEARAAVGALLPLLLVVAAEVAGLLGAPGGAGVLNLTRREALARAAVPAPA